MTAKKPTVPTRSGADNVPALDIAQILGGHSCPEWLKDEAQSLAAAAAPFQRVAAIGLLLRLWMPTDRSEKHIFQQALITGAPIPVKDRARAWLEALSQNAIASFEADAIERANALYSSINSLVQLVAADDPQAANTAQALFTARDDLSSVQAALQVRNAGERLQSTLPALDHHFGIHGDVFDALDIPDTPRLLAAATVDPDVVWAPCFGLFSSAAPEANEPWYIDDTEATMAVDEEKNDDASANNWPPRIPLPTPIQAAATHTAPNPSWRFADDAHKWIAIITARPSRNELHCTLLCQGDSTMPDAHLWLFGQKHPLPKGDKLVEFSMSLLAAHQADPSQPQLAVECPNGTVTPLHPDP
ncbi:MAG: hypothetical protein M0R76_02035 [Proteobacteria bacterium]|nr:hypothetical protein [Pseudomonadota bacterium]